MQKQIQVFSVKLQQGIAADDCCFACDTNCRSENFRFVNFLVSFYAKIFSGIGYPWNF